MSPVGDYPLLLPALLPMLIPIYPARDHDYTARATWRTNPGHAPILLSVENDMPTSGFDFMGSCTGGPLRLGQRRPKAKSFKGSKAAKRAARLHRKHR